LEDVGGGEGLVSKRRGLELLIFIGCGLLLVGCTSEDHSVEFLYRQAHVDLVEIQIAEHAPGGDAASPSVLAIISVTVSESCATVTAARQVFDPDTDTFYLTVSSRRPIEEDCQQTEIPYETAVVLDVDRLPSGTYTVLANGVSASFQLEAPVSPML